MVLGDGALRELESGINTGHMPSPARHAPISVGLRGESDNGLSADLSLYGAVTYLMDQSVETFSALGLISPPNQHVGNYNFLSLRGYRFW